MYLNIPGTPVVHDDQPKDVLLGLGDRDWLTQLVAWTDEERLHTKGGLRQGTRWGDKPLPSPAQSPSADMGQTPVASL